MLTRILCWLAIGLLAGVALLSAVYLTDMNSAYARVQGKSTVVPSPYGDIE